jgi:hypothetical protein
LLSISLAWEAESKLNAAHLSSHYLSHAERTAVFSTMAY